jgi:hypothetical protein
MLIKPDSERIPYFILSMASENTRSLVKVDMLYVLVIHDKKDKLTTDVESNGPWEGLVLITVDDVTTKQAPETLCWTTDNGITVYQHTNY